MLWFQPSFYFCEREARQNCATGRGAAFFYYVVHVPVAPVATFHCPTARAATCCCANLGACRPQGPSAGGGSDLIARLLSMLSHFLHTLVLADLAQWACRSPATPMDGATALEHSAHMEAFTARLKRLSACGEAEESCPRWWQLREDAWRQVAAASEHQRLCTHRALFADFLPTSPLRLKEALDTDLTNRYTGEYTPHDYWEPEYACFGDKRIPAAVGDGPKWVCGIQHLPQPCRLVSLGSNFDDSFERAVHGMASCAAYIVDPTLTTRGVVSGVVRTESVPVFEARLASYGAALNGTVGVGNPRVSNAQFHVVKMASLLHDRYGPPPWRVEVLKVDVEGAEKHVLHEVFALCASGQLSIDQLNVELHTSPTWCALTASHSPLHASHITRTPHINLILRDAIRAVARDIRVIRRCAARPGYPFSATRVVRALCRASLTRTGPLTHSRCSRAR